MKESKSIEPADRLSELPDSLIFKIFEFLPTRDFVRTPILSRRWKKLWTTSPCLYFETNSDYNDEFRNFVNRALLCWRGTRVQKFKVSGVSFDASLFTEIDLWVLFAVDNRVEELDIWFQYIDFDFHQVDYCISKCLYSCSSLQKLSLFCSGLEIKGKVQWNRLKNLKIECLALNQHDIDQILCGSPLLEVFSLSFRVEVSESEFSFRSCSLKKLSIYQTCSNPENIIDSVLRIWTPNLVMLTISGEQFDNCLLMNVSSLARANLLFYGTFLLWETLSQILPAIQHVEGLTLSQICTEVLGAMNIKSSLSPFLNVKFLCLTYRFEELERIVRLVEIFPKLKTLVVEDEGGWDDPNSKVKFKPNPSESFLVELKTVEVTWIRHNFLVSPFIKIILKYASKLEKMVFRVKRTEPSNNLLLASKKLLKMPRSSPCAKLVIQEY